MLPGQVGIGLEHLTQPVAKWVKAQHRWQRRVEAEHMTTVTELLSSFVVQQIGEVRTVAHTRFVPIIGLLIIHWEDAGQKQNAWGK